MSRKCSPLAWSSKWPVGLDAYRSSKSWASTFRICVQSTYVRWKRGYAHTAEEGSDRDEAADFDRPESSSSEEDDADLASEVAPEEQPSGAVPLLLVCLSNSMCAALVLLLSS